MGIVRRSNLAAIAVAILCVGAYALARLRSDAALGEGRPATEVIAGEVGLLRPLDARGIKGVREITKSELIALIAKDRPLSSSEKAQLDRGCPGLTCLYQGLGQKRWPESARGTRAYLRGEDAVNRRCPDGQQNFVFVKQAWWTSGKPPTPDWRTGEVPLSSVTRTKPGWYTFNYAVYFPATKTYVWINHREYGFPANLVWPMKAYLSLLPPLLEEGRPAQIYCSTCR